MKRGVIAIFLLLTTMVFAEDSQIDETRELRERVVKLEAVIERMEKERLSSIDYYESSFEDSKEYYKNTLEDSKGMYENGLSSVRWTVGISSTILGMVMAILGIILAWVKISSDKKLEVEKKEIINSLEAGKTEIEETNKITLDELKNQKLYIEALEENLKRDVEKANNELEVKIKEVDKKLEKVDEQTKEIREKHIETKINAGVAQALSKRTEEEKYQELKKLEEELKDFDEKFKMSLYYEIAFNTYDKEESILYYTKIIDENKSRLAFQIKVGAYIGRANEYFLKGDLKKAKDDYEKAKEIDSSNPATYLNLGKLYLALGSLNEAKESIDIFIEKIPNYSVAYEIRGVVYLYLDKMKDALDDLVKSIQLERKKAFNLKLNKKLYIDFINYLDDKENKNDLEEEVLKRFGLKEGIIVTD